MATLSGFFGALALVLASVGLYGVMAYMVARRRNEIAIRLALGADRRSIVRMVMREAAALVGIGLALGIALTAFASTAAKALLFGLTPSDPTALALAVGALGLVGLGSSYIPAERAARLLPSHVLPEE
jgi:ABC-type antimicrobial peptide transport system permease subunit